MYIYFLMSMANLGRRRPGGDHVLSKSTGVPTKHIWLGGCTFTMTSFGITCVRCGSVA